MGLPETGFLLHEKRKPGFADAEPGFLFPSALPYAEPEPATRRAISRALVVP
jgi:hypothetical protein